MHSRHSSRPTAAGHAESAICSNLAFWQGRSWSPLVTAGIRLDLGIRGVPSQARFPAVWDVSAIVQRGTAHPGPPAPGQGGVVEARDHWIPKVPWRTDRHRISPPLMILLFARCLLVCPGTTRQRPAQHGRKPRRSPHGPAHTGIESTDLIAEQRALNPRVRGSNPWRRTRSDLALYPIRSASWRPFPGHVCSTFARQSGPSPRAALVGPCARPFRPAWCAVPAAASAPVRPYR